MNGDIPRLSLGASATSEEIKRALNAAAAANYPHVFELGSDHALLPHWTPESLVASMPSLRRAYVSRSSPIFGPYHDVNRPMAKVHNMSALHDYYEDDVRSADFFAAGSLSHRYYSGEVDRDLPEPMLSALQPLERVLIARGPARASVNLWLGRAPVSAPCHFDGYENAVVQLHGAKRFLLAPPSAWRALRPYPFLHPSHAQCQVTMNALLESGADRHEIQAIDLRRGDLLFIPPLWFHETIALASDQHNGSPFDGVIGVNGWVDGDEGEAAADLFSLPRPRPPQVRHTRDSKAAAAAALICLLSQSSFGSTEGGVAALVKRIWAERYSSLDLREGPPPFDGCSGWRGDMRIWLQHLPAKEWANAVARHAEAKLAGSTRASWLGNLAEYVVAERVGVGHVYAFWKELNACVDELDDV